MIRSAPLSRTTAAPATAMMIKLNFIRRASSNKTVHWEVIWQCPSRLCRS